MNTKFLVVSVVLIAALVSAGAPAFAIPGSDVAVLYVSAPSEAEKGSFVNIDVGVMNLGAQNETFNVTLIDTTDSSVIGVQTVNLAPNSTRTLNFGFNTSASSTGNHTLRAEASVVPDENNTANNVYTTSMYITEPIVPIHDVAVTSLYYPGTAITGSMVLINTTVSNNGNQPEIFNVTLFDSTDNTVIGVQTIILNAGASQWVFFTYNTSLASVGNHTITAYAGPVDGENNTADNEKSAVIVIILPDTIPPAAITDLSTGNQTSNSVRLTWTAPDDNGNTGAAWQYDLRYSTSPITEANWTSAMQVSGEPAPLSAGTQQAYTVGGLLANTTYYFAIKTADEVPNWSSISNVASATTLSPMTLWEALDNVNLAWATGGNSNWFGQTTTYYYGNDAAQSGAISHNQNNWMQTTVVGPGNISFYWKVSSERNYDYLRFYVNGVQKTAISGEAGWTKLTYTLPAGNQTLKWTYSKDGSVSSGSDAGWVDRVEYVAFAPDHIAPAAITNLAAGNATMSSVLLIWTATGDDGSAGTASQYDIRYSTSPITDANWANATQVVGEPTPSPVGTQQYMTVGGLSANTTYYFAIKAADEYSNWSPLSNVPSATTRPTISLGEALDNINITWVAGGNSNWFGQDSIYYYGGDAAKSGAIGHNGNTWVQTTASGPGILTFYWKVSSEWNYDYLRFYVNGVQKAAISGEAGWTLMTYNLTSGNQTLKWAYTKDGSVVRGSDAGWVDKVVYTPV